MSTPTIPPVSTTPAKPSGHAQVVQIVSLPDALKNNSRAVRLEGEVVQQNKDGSIRIRTPEGDIDINVRGRQPQQGQRIEIDIPPGSPPRQANIRPAPPVPQQPPSTQPPTTDLPDVPLPQTPVTKPAPPAQGTPTPPKDGTTQPVTIRPVTPDVLQTKFPDVFQPSQTTAPVKPLPALPPLAPGQIVQLVSAPAMPQTPAPAPITTTEMKAAVIAQKSEGNLITTLLQALKSALPSTLVGKGMESIPTPTTSGALLKTPLVMQQPLPLAAKILSLTLPSGQTIAIPQPQMQAPVTTAPSMPTPVVTAPVFQTATPVVTPPLIVTVTEFTAQNQPIIPIPINDKGAVQNFILQSPPASVPAGTQITLQPQLVNASVPTGTVPTLSTTITPVPANGMIPSPTPVVGIPASALPPAWRSLLPLMQSSTIWPVMDEMFQTFYQATPQAAQILGRTIPSPANGSNFGPALMLFAAALKSGDLQAWMGDKKLDMIQKLGKGSLMSRLSGETSALAGNTDAAATDWKSFPVPLLWQNEISKVLFHVRKEPSENEQENGEAATRFVMDLSLTRMGDVQLDGMVRGKQLDLIVRTQMPVSAHMQEAMRLAYAKALDGTDIYGDIGFQSDRTNWETILKHEDMLAKSI